MSALDDGVGPLFTEAFYKEMLNGKKGPKPCTHAAWALKKALEELGKAGNGRLDEDESDRTKVSLMQRINIVYYVI